MTGSFTSAIRTFGLLCAFGGYAHWLNAQAAGIEPGRCVATPGAGYFAPLSPASAQTSEVCFIRASEISDAIDQYLLIDAAAQSQSNKLTSNTIDLPDWQIKTKSFLKNKPLLIVAEPYKRHSLAKLCKELIQSGFQNPKILLGDVPVRDGVKRAAIAPVDEFIVEVSNFGAVTIATEQKVADELASLGIPAIAVEEGVDLKTAIRNAAVNYSLNGYLPVFIVGEQEAEIDLALRVKEKPTNNAFVVSGGIESIKRSLKTSALSSAKRLGMHGVSSCAG